MKIALPTDGDKLEDEVVSHFGKAKNFLIFDAEKEDFKVYSNPEAKGEVTLPPDFLKKLEVKVVICFSLGPRAFRLFKSYRIETKKAVKKNIKENINLFQKGKLKDLTEEDIF